MNEYFVMDTYANPGLISYLCTLKYKFQDKPLVDNHLFRLVMDYICCKPCPHLIGSKISLPGRPFNIDFDQQGRLWIIVGDRIRSTLVVYNISTAKCVEIELPISLGIPRIVRRGVNHTMLIGMNRHSRILTISHHTSLSTLKMNVWKHPHPGIYEHACYLAIHHKKKQLMTLDCLPLSIVIMDISQTQSDKWQILHRILFDAPPRISGLDWHPDTDIIYIYDERSYAVWQLSLLDVLADQSANKTNIDEHFYSATCKIERNPNVRALQIRLFQNSFIHSTTNYIAACHLSSGTNHIISSNISEPIATAMHPNDANHQLFVANYSDQCICIVNLEHHILT